MHTTKEERRAARLSKMDVSRIRTDDEPQRQSSTEKSSIYHRPRLPAQDTAVRCTSRCAPNPAYLRMGDSQSMRCEPLDLCIRNCTYRLHSAASSTFELPPPTVIFSQLKHSMPAGRFLESGHPMGGSKSDRAIATAISRAEYEPEPRGASEERRSSWPARHSPLEWHAPAGDPHLGRRPKASCRPRCLDPHHVLR